MSNESSIDFAKAKASASLPQVSTCEYFQLLTKEGKQCQCGKPFFPPHCPNCGSTNVYGKDANDELRQAPEQGVVILGEGYKCRKCKLGFNLLEQCEAPRFENASIRERRRVDKGVEAMIEYQTTLNDPVKHRAFMESLYHKVGIDPNKGRTTVAEQLAEQVKLTTEVSQKNLEDLSPSPSSSIIDDTKPIEDYEDKFFKQD